MRPCSNLECISVKEIETKCFLYITVVYCNAWTWLLSEIQRCGVYIVFVKLLRISVGKNKALGNILKKRNSGRNLSLQLPFFFFTFTAYLPFSAASRTNRIVTVTVRTVRNSISASLSAHSVSARAYWPQAGEFANCYGKNESLMLPCPTGILKKRARR